MTTFTFQLGDHAPFGLIAHTATCQESSSQVLLVEILENILVLEEAEDGDHLLECCIDIGIVGHASQTLAELVIHIKRQILGRPSVLVEEGFKGLLQRQLKVLAFFEGFLDKSVKLLLQTEDGCDETHGVFDLLWIVQDFSSCFAHAIHHHLLNLLQGNRHAAEEEIHPFEILNLVALEHPRTPRVLHVDQGLVVDRDPFFITQLLDLLHCGFVQIVLHPRFLLSNSLLRLLQIVGAGVLRDVLLGFILIELPGMVQERIFEAFSVDIFALHT
mmetsp:Transcript_40714/g.88190  ORF Transcript_40714/g.88190 Transcript_40714/m.88190 type:complete len:273 (-) Transcript_40714:637-1455(-)